MTKAEWRIKIINIIARQIRTFNGVPMDLTCKKDSEYIAKWIYKSLRRNKALRNEEETK